MPRLSLQLSTSPTHAHKSNTFANSFTTLIPVCTNPPPPSTPLPIIHKGTFFFSSTSGTSGLSDKMLSFGCTTTLFRGGGRGGTWAYFDQLCVRAITHMLQDAVNHTAHLLTQYAQGTCSLHTIHTLAVPAHPCTQVQRLATITAVTLRAETQTHTQTQCHNQARGLDNIHPKPLGTLPAAKLTTEYK